ncbi:rhomboid-like protein [Streptomyces sp. NPDC007983]|uniref:rhomboid-like protein n=1 Tax=Streptomyces sp. NPDC007983 TaxID=3364800 RepID=UPI0036F18CD4
MTTSVERTGAPADVTSPLPGPGRPATRPAGPGPVAGATRPTRPGPVAPDAATPRIPAPEPRRAPWWRPRLRDLLPTPTGTPFTLCYSLILLGTGLYAHLGDPRTVHDLLTGSSTDVSNLSQRPLLTLLASALWVVGGITSPYLVALLLVLSALEHRVGALRTAGVFVLGHVLATLLTEIPVAASVAIGHLPDSSLRRLDYGVSYGLIACAGALAGLLPPRPRWALIGGIGAALVAGSLLYFDPLTDWGHALALLTGTACGPYVRHVAQRRGAGPSGRAPRTA